MSWWLLTELALRERELVDAARWDDLEALQAERQRVIDELPTPLPLEAKGILEEALRQSRATEAALKAALEETGGFLTAVRRGRRAIAAYAWHERSGLETSA